MGATGGGSQTPTKRISAGNTIAGSERGDFIFDAAVAGTCQMILPYWGSKAKTLFHPFAKQDNVCPFGLNCEFLHEYINDMTPKVAYFYKQWVLNTKGVSFNPKYVSLDILKCEFIKNNAKAPAETPAPGKGETAKE